MATIDQPTVGAAPGPSTSPAPLLDLSYAAAKTLVLRAAMQLRIFTILADGPLDAAGVAEEAGAVPASTERLLKVLVTLGVLEEEAPGAYGLTPAARDWFVEGTPTYIGANAVAALDNVTAWSQLADILRTGEPARDLSADDEAEAVFGRRARDLFPVAHLHAQRAVAAVGLPDADPIRLLDVSARAAPWGVAFAAADPRVQVTAVDLPDIATQGRRHVEELGYGPRFSWLSGDLLTAPLAPSSFEVAVVGGPGRYWSDDRNREVLRCVRRLLVPGGRLVFADVVLGPDGAGPPFAFVVDITLLASTRHGRVRRIDEVTAWLEEAGFTEVERVDCPGDPMPLVVAVAGGPP